MSRQIRTGTRNVESRFDAPRPLRRAIAALSRRSIVIYELTRKLSHEEESKAPRSRANDCASIPMRSAAHPTVSRRDSFGLALGRPRPCRRHSLALVTRARYASLFPAFDELDSRKNWLSHTRASSNLCGDLVSDVKLT